MGLNSLCCGRWSEWSEVYEELPGKCWVDIQGIYFLVIGWVWIWMEVEGLVDTLEWVLCDDGVGGAYMSLSEEWNGESYW